MTNFCYRFLLIFLLLPVLLFADPPVAQPDSAETLEEVPVTIAVANNDSDPDGDLDLTSITITDPPSNGTATVNPDGTITYEPDQDYNGIDSFTYDVCDTTTPTPLCDEATVVVEVTPVDDPPVANDDPVSTAEDMPIDIPVAGNDSDPDGDLDLTSITITDPPSNGTATVNPDGTITYEPDQDYNGIDSFTYEVCDTTTPTPLCDDATVTVEVTPVNNPPIAQSDTEDTAEDTPVIIPVASNDSDPDGDLDPSTISVIVSPTNGTTVANSDGTITYTPNPGFTGTDTFAYQICDSAGNCDEADVIVNVAIIGCLTVICPLYYRAPLPPQQSQETYTSISSGMQYCVSIRNSDQNIGLLRFKPNLTEVDINSEADYLFEYEYYGGVCPIQIDNTIEYKICKNACSTGSSLCKFHKVDINFGGYADCQGKSVSNPCPPFSNAPVAPNQFGVKATTGLTEVLRLSNCSSVDETSIVVSTPPSNGVATVSTDGAINYTPEQGFVGLDSLLLNTNEGVITVYFFTSPDTAIPTLSEWGMIILGLLMLGLVWVHFRP